MNTSLPANSSSVPAGLPPKVSRLRVVLALVVLAAAVLLILRGWQLPPFDGPLQHTDNAYVRGRTAVIAPQVSGYVVEVAVKDYQQVQRGQVLVRIDSRIYAARVEQAKAAVAAQIAQLENATQAKRARAAAITAQDAALANAQAQLQRARVDLARVDELVSDGSVALRERDQNLAAHAQAEAQVRQASAALDMARQDLRTVEVGRDALVANVEAAHAQLRLAQIDLDNTVIRAAEDGQLGEVGVRLGQYVTNGTQLLQLVPAERWVVAHFKEAQTAAIRPGQYAEVRIDALQGQRLAGRVQLVAPAAGSEFAAIKPDTTTGNFVKIPQRIGVKIVFDNAATAALLRPGMSVEATVDPGRMAEQQR